MIWELLNSCFHRWCTLALPSPHPRRAFALPGGDRCLLGRGAAWMVNWGCRWRPHWWHPNGWSPSRTPCDNPKLFSTSRALDHILSMEGRARCPTGPRKDPQTSKVMCKCPELKGFVFISQRSAPYWDLICKLPGDWLVGEVIELGGTPEAGGACPGGETLLVLDAPRLNSRL